MRRKTQEILSLREVMQMTGLSRPAATKLLNTPGCPVLPREKNQAFRVPKKAFEDWLLGGNF